MVLVGWTLAYLCFTHGVHLPTSFLGLAQNRCGQSQELLQLNEDRAGGAQGLSNPR